LVGTNNIVKNRVEAHDKDFGNEFVNDVAEANGSKIFEGLRLVNFGNERNESVRNGRVKVASLESSVH